MDLWNVKTRAEVKNKKQGLSKYGREEEKKKNLPLT